MNELLQKFFAPGVPSEQWKLNKWDFIKATVMGVFGPAIMMVIDALMKFFNGKDPLAIDWQLVAKTAGACFLSYIIKNFLSPSNNPPLK